MEKLKWKLVIGFCVGFIFFFAVFVAQVMNPAHPTANHDQTEQKTVNYQVGYGFELKLREDPPSEQYKRWLGCDCSKGE